jgi:16S rRNA (guanine527-N7)-methyltransferase
VKHSPTDELARAVDALGLAVPQEALERLAQYEELLRERAVPLGIVSASDATRIFERHVLDCLRAIAALEDADREAYDIGSGGGLPGLVVAIARSTPAVRLVEPRRTRVAFLELVIDRLRIENASVVPTRIEQVEAAADVCFARAFAPLEETWKAAWPRLRAGGRLVYFAGAGSTVAATSGSGALAPLDGASSARVLSAGLLESSGPLIIMTR